MIHIRKNKKLRNLLVVILILTLTIGNWSVLGSWLVSTASSNTLSLQGDETKNENVKFNIGILENDNLVYSTKSDINEALTLKSYISVENEGVLKDICLTFLGENDTDKNFEIIETKQQEGTVKSASVNEYELNQISEGTVVELEFIASWNREIQNDINKLNQNNIIKLSAIYVDSKGKETNIDKNIMLNIEWECNNEIGIESNIERYASYEFWGNRGIVITQIIGINQNKFETMPFEKVTVEAEQIKINEKLPDSIIVKGENKDIPFEIIDNQIKITDENKIEDAIIQNRETSKKYNITYIFNNAEILETLDINTNINANAKIYGSKNEKVASINYHTGLEETIGNIIEVKSTEIGNISKGKIYANYN